MSGPSVLAVVTSHRESNSLPTGFFLPELAYPYHHLTRRGCMVEVASPAGGEVFISPWSDPRNPQGTESGDLVGLGFLHWTPAVQALSATVAVREVDPHRYVAVWVVGGIGPVFDLADDTALREVLLAMWSAGKPLAAVCHGTIALAGLDTNRGPLIEGHNVTGCSKAEDQAIERSIPVPNFRLPCYVEDELRGRGGIYRAVDPRQPLVVHGAQGRLLTGQNQQSADEFGRALANLVGSWPR